MTTPAKRPPLSVIVPTSGRPDLLDGALSSLRESLADSDELVVVESGSQEPEPVWEVARRHGARLLVADVRGVSKARNLGWQEALHDHVAFIDDDIRVQPGWASAMAAALAAHPNAAFVSGRIDLPEGQGTLSLTVKDDDDVQEFDQRSGGVIGHSANLGMHRAVLAEVGGFDEAMGPGRAGPPVRIPTCSTACSRPERTAGTHPTPPRITSTGGGFASTSSCSTATASDPEPGSQS